MTWRLGVRSAPATALVAGLAVALPALLAGCGDASSQADVHPPSPSASTKFEPTPRDLNEIRTVVAQRANALNDGDVREFLATVDPTNDSLRSHQRTLFDNLTELSGSPGELQHRHQRAAGPRPGPREPIRRSGPALSSTSRSRRSPTRSATRST